MYNHKKKIVIIVMCIVAIFMATGYALLSTNLNIKGTSQLTDTWGVRIESITSSASGRAYNITEPSYTNTNMTFNVGVKEPGDYMLFTIVLKNYGTLDAILDKVDISSSGSYVIKYDTFTLSEGIRLLAGESKTFNIRAYFDINATEIPTELTKELTVDISFVQDDGQTLTPTIPDIEGENTLAQTVLLNNQVKNDSKIDFSKPSSVMTSYTENHGTTASTVSFGSSTTYYFGTYYKFDKKTGNYSLDGNIKSSTWADMINDYHVYSYTCKNTSATGTCTTLYKMTSTSSQTAGLGYFYTRASTYSSINGQGLYYTITNTEGNKPVYYFRGNVTNNYVTFANKLWKIVRINEDGSIRLILNDYTSVGTSSFVSGMQAAYVGYMYGTPNASSYELEHANVNSSVIKQLIDNWYTINLSTFSSYLKDAGFCGDRSAEPGKAYGTNVGSFGGLMRTTPQFICPQTNDLYTTKTSPKGNKALDNPIGLIAMDELWYSGYSKNSTGGTSYIKLSNSELMWTMTPSSAPMGGNYVLSCAQTTCSINSNYASTALAVPVINLKANVKLEPKSTGEFEWGTIDNPYVVKTS